MNSSTYTEAVDMWGVGCLLYSLLVGKAPFDENENLSKNIRVGMYNRDHASYKKLEPEVKGLI